MGWIPRERRKPSDCLFSSGSPVLSKFPDPLKIPGSFPTFLFEGRERPTEEGKWRLLLDSKPTTCPPSLAFSFALPLGTLLGSGTVEVEGMIEARSHSIPHIWREDLESKVELGIRQRERRERPVRSCWRKCAQKRHSRATSHRIGEHLAAHNPGRGCCSMRPEEFG